MNEIEDLKKELKQTQLAYQMAAQMSEFKGGFLARTSHELRSPLTSLIGLHQLILSDLCESPEEQKEFITQAYNSALKLMKLIDEIIIVSKTESGTTQLNIQALQLAEIFTSIYNVTHLQAANRSINLEIVPPDYSLYIEADRARLIQLIINLIDSGISIVESSGKITTKAIVIPEKEIIKIEIDFQCSIDLWQKSGSIIEPEVTNNIEEIRELVEEINLSPNMRVLLSQNLLETMGGTLELLDLSDKEPMTRIVLTCKQTSLGSSN